MKRIRIADETLKAASRKRDISLTFREKTEIAKLLEKAGVDYIELPEIYDVKTDTLLVKTVSAVIRKACVVLPVGHSAQEIDLAWSSLRNAAKARLQVCVPVSPVQMEYFCHKKSSAVLEMIGELVAKCASLCNDVEFVAEDATRSEPDFLSAAIEKAVAAGAKTITICDTAGTMMSDEFAVFITNLDIPAGIALGVRCSNAMDMACACTAASIRAGADEIQTAVAGFDAPALSSIAQLFRLRGDSCAVTSGLDHTGLQRIETQIINFIRHRQEQLSKAEENDIFANGVLLTKSDDAATVAKAVKKLGYDLSDDDNAKVFEAFKTVAAKKNVSLKELDAIVASAAMQVPPVYRMKSYVSNSGSDIISSATIEIEKNGTILHGISMGDGPIDAAFMAIEQIIGVHYELDDFRIRSITEGRDSVGNAIIRLRANGKLYSGNGISTDIVGASIRAYLNALNKIVYEEEKN
ncbi:MAG: hypothetical protein E7523_02545 [Ruminococcaceae bacterium]|nr:hypothetical protein [Oscillospiraceae bacterium]